MVTKMKDIGIDLGTANVLLYIKGQGISLNEPSVVAIEKETKKAIAYGDDAFLMLGKTPGKYEAIRPMKDGVIADFDLTLMMLNHFINKVKGYSMFRKPRIIICCPTDTTEVEKNALCEAAERLGAKKVIISYEPKVAAIGVGLDITKPYGNMIVDIGGGTTDIAVLSLGDIVISKSIKIAGNLFDNDIRDYIKNKYKLLIGDKTSQNVKHQIGTVTKQEKKKTMQIKGRDLVTGLPKLITISNNDIYEALIKNINKIIESIKEVLEITPPELSADIMENGIILTGGGSLLNGMDKYFSEKLGVKITLASNPLTSVAEGTGIMLDNLHKFKIN